MVIGKVALDCEVILSHKKYFFRKVLLKTEGEKLEN